MLQRLVALLLVLSILGYGTLLVVDVHGLPGDAPAVVHADGDDDGHAGIECGHCSHGVVHLLGITPRLELSLPDAVRVLAGGYRGLVAADPPALLLRPPIA